MIRALVFCPDIRTLEHVPGRSINLAMSVRGLSALSNLPAPFGSPCSSLGDHVRTQYGIPMRARMIHPPAKADGKVETYAVPYGKDGQCIYSVGRRYLNEILLTGKTALQNRTKA